MDPGGWKIRRSKRLSSVSSTADGDLSREQKSWRYRIFASTWLCYAGLYFCRKPFYIVKGALSDELGFDATSLGLIGTAYLVAYMLGQFITGVAGSRWGPRLVLLLGMAISIGVSASFGFANNMPTFLVLMTLNGFAQATGWACSVGTMANWFRRSERGRVMGIWTTNFQVGGVLANTLAAFVLGAYGFRYSFLAGSAVLALVWLFFLFNQRNCPEDLGLAAIVEDESGSDVSTKGPVISRAVWTNVLLVGGFYFFVKFIRYALWSWTPFFLNKNYGLQGDDAGYLSTLFDLAGIAGVIVTGFLSDKVFKSRRAGVSLLMMVALMISCLLMTWLGTLSVPVFAVCLAMVGFTLYGPDALMTGAAAMDIGSRRGATLAAGVINGVGSAGSVVQELVIGRMYDSGGGSLGPIFALLLGSSIMATLVMAVMVVRNRMGKIQV